MRRQLFWSRHALDELKSIASYIARDNPLAARKVAASIREAGNKLGEQAIGRKGRVAGTYERSIISLPYIIAYALTQRPTGREAVVILRVIHTSRDWPSVAWPVNNE